MATKKKTIYTFKTDITKKVGYINAIMGFWFRMTYQKYVDEIITYDEAMAVMVKLSTYTGS